MAKLITKEQMAEQESYIMKLKEENMRYAAQNGHAKLALTETYGCQQNENDTERIRGMLRQAGFDFTDDSNKADVVIYNTCAVRENAEQKVFGRLGILKHIKEERKDMVIGVCILPRKSKKYTNTLTLFSEHTHFTKCRSFYTEQFTKRKQLSILTAVTVQSQRIFLLCVTMIKKHGYL